MKKKIKISTPTKISEQFLQLATQIIAEKGYITSIDIFLALNWLSPENLTLWKTQKVPYLEQVITANLSKISENMKMLKMWATQSNLTPSYAQYKYKGVDLRFSKFVNKHIEDAYHTHYAMQNTEPNFIKQADA